MLRLVKFARSKPALEAGAERAPVDPLAMLVRAAQNGERAAQRALVIALGPALLRAVRGVLGARHLELEDVLQEAMAATLSALAGFRGECQTVHFGARVAVQTAMNARRRASYRTRLTPSTPPEEVAELSRDDHTPGEALRAALRREALRSLLDELPPVQSEALVLHVILGYSVQETAQATGSPLNTVRSRLRAALSALRSRLQSDRALLEDLDVTP